MPAGCWSTRPPASSRPATRPPATPAAARSPAGPLVQAGGRVAGDRVPADHQGLDEERERDGALDGVRGAVAGIAGAGDLLAGGVGGFNRPPPGVPLDHLRRRQPGPRWQPSSAPQRPGTHVRTRHGHVAATREHPQASRRLERAACAASSSELAQRSTAPYNRTTAPFRAAQPSIPEVPLINGAQSSVGRGAGRRASPPCRNWMARSR